jgi:hypothetical protein
MSVSFVSAGDGFRKRAADELRRIVCELILVSGLNNEQIADLMGYKSRNIVSIMRNYQDGLPLYSGRALFAFLLAVGVRYAEDIDYVFGIYDIVAGRETTRAQTVIRPTRRDWWREQKLSDPTTDNVTLDRSQQREFARLILSS